LRRFNWCDGNRPGYSAATSVDKEIPVRIRSALVGVVAAAGLAVLSGGPALAAPSGQDRTWMAAAHQSNLAEIAAGQAAQQQGTSAEVKRLGAMFIQMHSQLDASLKQAASGFGVDLPDAPNAQQQQALASVSAKSGDAFDAAWLASQITGHRQTLAATQKELASGSDATTLKLARTATPVVKQHLSELLQASGSPGSVNAGTGGQAAQAGWVSTPVGITGIALAVIGVVVLAGSALRRQRARA
jgi:putative membrane protein